MPNSTTKNHKNQYRKLKVVELFAGVGGFRIGLCGTPKKLKRGYEIAWANQWEPGTRIQHAAMVYKEKFHGSKEPNIFFNEDINKVANLNKLPVPKHDLLVGGFPCQDYSVARTLSHAAGLEGKKGVLWWAIHKIIKRLDKNAPNYLMLENVDRLLKSPAKQRGRDFGIILASLANLGYIVEWRVINAADYGMPQRRKRTFIMAYKENSPIGGKALKSSPALWLTNTGPIAKAFPVHKINNPSPTEIKLSGDLLSISEKFEYQFDNTGFMKNGKFISIRTLPKYTGLKQTLGSILISGDKVPQEYFLNEKDMERWRYLKGAKNQERKSKTGFKYVYKEGPVTFPDPLDKPSRTIITGEGGATPARHKHVILTPNGKYRRLTPIELEKLCMFPEGHTELPGISAQRRAFFMGNALVVGVTERLGKSLLKQHRTTLK
ncbi:MAG: DNA (cytosine-5-)-methyltransferase [bacterium]|nr:DNA (cytosine-5-)-methyltransferase [bacterium]